MKLFAILFLSAMCVPTVPPHDGELYQLAMLRPSPDRQALPAADADRLQAAHMANIQKMAAEGVLVAAGPMDDDPTTISGFFFFKVASTGDAQRIALQDPTVLAHRNTIDVHSWRGPVGFGEGYRKWTAEHPGTPPAMGGHALCIFLQTAPLKPELSNAHAQWMETLHARGLLGAAGPMEGDAGMEGMAIFKDASIDAATKLIDEDPAVKSGDLKPELHEWWSMDRVLPW